MRKIILLTVAAAFALAANAKVWRINYDETAQADFATITAACESEDVMDGDTLYAEPGYHRAEYTQNFISRQLTVLGPGYLMEHNAGSTATISGAVFTESITITSSNVHVAGITTNLAIVIPLRSESDPIIQDIVIERCLAWRILYNRGVKNITIRNNFVNRDISCEYYDNNINHLSIIGNVVVGNIVLPRNNTSLNNSCLHNTVVVTRDDYCIIAQNAVIKDNIFIRQDGNQDYIIDCDNTNEFRNNVLGLDAEHAIGYFPNNLYVGATVENTFVNATEGAWQDEAGKYRLLNTSAAKGAAQGGEDCGAFAGDNPYVLFGHPQGVPYIYDVEVPDRPTNNQLRVTFKVSGQNE